MTDDPALAALLDPADCHMTSGGVDGVWCIDHDSPWSEPASLVCDDRLTHDIAMADLARKAAAWDAVHDSLHEWAEVWRLWGQEALTIASRVWAREFPNDPLPDFPPNIGDRVLAAYESALAAASPEDER